MCLRAQRLPVVPRLSGDVLMIGWHGWSSGAFDPDPEHDYWTGPQDTAPVQPDGSMGEVYPDSGINPIYTAGGYSGDMQNQHTPGAERALAEFEQLLHEWDSRTTVAKMLDELDRQLGRLRPGGQWAKNEEEAVKLLRLLAYRMRRKLA